MAPSVLTARLAAQVLTGPPGTDVEEAVRRLLALQGQDPRGFRLAVRARTAATTAADVDAALTERRSLVVSWLQRGTLHLVAARDFWWLHDLVTPPLAATSRTRLAQEGVTPTLARRGIDLVVDAVAGGPRTREQLRAVLDAGGVPTAGQALVHVLLAATLEHALIRGPVIDGEHAMVLAEDWLGPRPAVGREEALVRLAARYLAGHGPASDRDLATWAKLPLRDVRAGLAGAGTVDAGEGLVDLPDRSPPVPLRGPRLLGNFDPVLHGWASRAAVLGAHDADVVTGGIYRSFVLGPEGPLGRWRIERGRVEVLPYAPLPSAAVDAIRAEAADVARFLGLPPAEVRVRAPA